MAKKLEGTKMGCPFLFPQVFANSLAFTTLEDLLVGATGFEPATSWSQTTRATNCATPRLMKRQVYNGFLPHSSTAENKKSLASSFACGYTDARYGKEKG